MRVKILNMPLSRRYQLSKFVIKKTVRVVPVGIRDYSSITSSNFAHSRNPMPLNQQNQRMTRHPPSPDHFELDIWTIWAVSMTNLSYFYDQFELYHWQMNLIKSCSASASLFWCSDWFIPLNNIHISQLEDPGLK